MTRNPKAVQYADADIFTAIAHPLRRQILDMLAEGELPVKQIATSFPVSRPAISQHLRVLLDTGLVSEQRMGREHYYALHAERLREVERWLRHYERFWPQRLDALDAYLRETHAPLAAQLTDNEPTSNDHQEMP